MKNICPHCGAELDENSAFCPHCAQSVSPTTPAATPPFIFPRKIKYLCVLLLLAAAICGGIYLYLKPDVYDGPEAEVNYRDDDGEYQILLGKTNDRFTPFPEVSNTAESGKDYRFPVCLYINHKDSGSNAKDVFLKKVDKITAEMSPSKNTKTPITCSEPTVHDGIPEAARISLVDYIGSENYAELTFSIHMKNGDIIRLHQKISISLVETYDYYQDTTPIDTTEKLQAAIDEISETADPSAIINFHLPPVTYSGSLHIEKRKVNLFGNTEGDGRTTFTDTLHVNFPESGGIVYINDIDFAGSSNKIGISASSRVHIAGCNFTDWKTGVLGYGSAWVNIQTSHFENNNIGFHFNSKDGSVTHSQYPGNEFVGNQTGILFENVPTDKSLSFDECIFSKNGTDIDNRCQHEIDISKAIFQ